MNSNPDGEPVITGTTDQFTEANTQAVQDLTGQTPEQSRVENYARRRTDDTAGVGAGHPEDVDPHAEVVLHAERLLISRARYATERVRFTKQIVTTTRTIEIPVRIEQLVISHEPFSPNTPADSPAATSANTLVSDGAEAVAANALVGVDSEGAHDVIIVLHEEVPEFTLRVAPVERIRIGVRTVVAEQTITATLGSETISVDQQQVDQTRDWTETD